MKTIDIHSHLATPAARLPVAIHHRYEFEPYDYFMGQDSKDRNKRMIPDITDRLTVASRRARPWSIRSTSGEQVREARPTPPGCTPDLDRPPGRTAIRPQPSGAPSRIVPYPSRCPPRSL